ncbi:MAG: nucleotidyltransferase family protein [Saccharofermentans sp.]|nr:nucleotidyltransferase family protein [Saccharofermentans sp.]
MKPEEQVLLSLLKKSQFGIDDNIKWDSVDMDALYNEASLQSVLSPVASYIPVEFSNSKWIEAQYRQKASYIRYCHAQDELKSILDDSGISFVILKGNASAISYKEPSLRMMGDIDLLMPQDLYSKTKKIMSDKGYIVGEDNGRHCHFRKNGQEFEVHHHFSHFEEIDIENFVINGLNSREIVSVDNHEFPILPKLANGLVLLDHFRRHLESAVGLRHVVDWMMYVYRNLDDDFWFSHFKQVVEEKGMDKLAITITRMCQIYIGLPMTITWCSSADESLCEQLMSCILSSGNFGRKNEKGHAVEAVSTNLRKIGLFRWLQHAGEHNWKVYHKHHWLKPFCWFYQIFRYAKQGFKTGRNKKQLKGDLDRSKERYELLKKLGIG